MDSTGLLLLFRSEMSDVAEPYLWSDEEVLSYIDDAQKMFCRKTEGIPDDLTPAITQLAVPAGADRIALSPLLRRIRSARRHDNGRPVEVISEEEMVKRNWAFDGRPGIIKALVLGAGRHSARIYPAADAATQIDLVVFRMPLTAINDADQALEVDEEHHRHLLLWCKHLGYSKHDVETYDKAKAAEFEVRFLGYCAAVTEEERRKRHKTRVVQYGGL